MGQTLQGDGTLLRGIPMVVVLTSLVGAAYAAGSETFTGVASRSGTYKRPLLIVGGKRYELKASDKADASVAEMLAKFSKGDKGKYVVKGTRGTLRGVDGILIDSITPAPQPAAQTTPTVTSEVVTVSNRKYTAHEFTDPDSKTYCVVIPEGLKTVRGLFVNPNCYAGNSRGDWTFCHYYREFMHLHDFALVAANGTCPHASAFKGFRKSLQCRRMQDRTENRASGRRRGQP